MCLRLTAEPTPLLGCAVLPKPWHPCSTLLVRPPAAGVSLFMFDPDSNDVIKQARVACWRPGSCSCTAALTTLPWDMQRVLLPPQGRAAHPSRCLPASLLSVTTAERCHTSLHTSPQVVTYRQPSQEEYALYLVS